MSTRRKKTRKMRGGMSTIKNRLSNKIKIGSLVRYSNKIGKVVHIDGDELTIENESAKINIENVKLYNYDKLILVAYEIAGLVIKEEYKTSYLLTNIDNVFDDSKTPYVQPSPQPPPWR